MTEIRSGLDVLGALIQNGSGQVFEPFEAPTHAPQFDEPPEEGKSIRELLEEAPKMDPAFYPELEHAIRTSIAVRSAIAYAMEVARLDELKLRNADDMNEVCRAQGSVAGLQRYYVGIITMLEALPEPEQEEDEDVEDEEFPI